MAQQQVLEFKEIGIGASVVLMGKNRQELGIMERGVLNIPSGVKPNAFSLILNVSKKARVIVLKKDVKQDRGDYHNDLTSMALLPNCDVVVYQIPVMRQGANVWTSWHQANPNRLDCWRLRENGWIDLLQVGIITHDNGETFHLLGEYRWRGKLFRNNGNEIIGQPAEQKWGSFAVRKSILKNPDFAGLLDGTSLQNWRGKPDELSPPLERVPNPGFARVSWYIPFGGRNGQGIALLHDGTSAWIHGQDILDPPCNDGIKRLQRNDLVKYKGEPINWGNKEDAPPKLLKVRKVR